MCVVVMMMTLPFFESSSASVSISVVFPPPPMMAVTPRPTCKSGAICIYTPSVPLSGEARAVLDHLRRDADGDLLRRLGQDGKADGRVNAVDLRLGKAVAAQTLARIRQSGAAVYRTDLSGTITIRG